MATIKKRKTNYSVIYRYAGEDGKTKQKWESFKERKEAETRKKYIEYYQEAHGLVLVPNDSQHENVQEKNQAKEPASDSDITLSEFLEIFVNLYGTSKWSASTYSSKVGEIRNYINPYIGDWKLRDITTKKLSVYYNDLLNIPEVPSGHRPPSGRCVTPSGVKKIHDILRCALNQAIRWEYLDQSMRNPATLATLPKVKKVRRNVWSVDTFKKALSVCEDDTLHICMQLAFSCSLRVGEICGLTWQDVCIDDAAIESGNAYVRVNKELSRVTFEAMQKLNNKDIIKVFPTLMPHCSTRLVLKAPKTESSVRTVWLPPTVAKLLLSYRSAQAEMKSFLGSAYNDYDLVVALDNGNPVESRIVRNRFQELCEKNGFETVVFHSLRHLSCGYKLKLTGGDIKSVQGDTGHAESEMVLDVYSEVIDEDRRKNAQKMEDEFYAQAPKKKAFSTEDLKILQALKALPPELKAQLLNL